MGAHRSRKEKRPNPCRKNKHMGVFEGSRMEKKTSKKIERKINARAGFKRGGGMPLPIKGKETWIVETRKSRKTMSCSGREGEIIRHFHTIRELRGC